MKPQYIKMFLLLVIILIIAPLYILVQGYVARFTFPFKFIKILGLVVTTIGLDLIGSFAVALVTLLPVGYMFPKRWTLISTVLVAITLVVLIFTYPANIARSWRLNVIRVGEYVMIFIAYFLMAWVGSRLAHSSLKTVI